MILSKKDIFKASLDGTLVEKIDEAMSEAFVAGVNTGHHAGLYHKNYYDIPIRSSYKIWRSKTKQVEK